MKKPTFKNHYPEGRYRSFYHTRADIFLNKKKIGYIMFHESKNGFRITFHVTKGAEDPVENCPWKNVTLKKSFEGSETQQLVQAKQWIKDNWGAISSMYPIHPTE